MKCLFIDQSLFPAASYQHLPLGITSSTPGNHQIVSATMLCLYFHPAVVQIYLTFCAMEDSRNSCICLQPAILVEEYTQVQCSGESGVMTRRRVLFPPAMQKDRRPRPNSDQRGVSPDQPSGWQKLYATAVNSSKLRWDWLIGHAEMAHTQTGRWNPVVFSDWPLHLYSNGSGQFRNSCGGFYLHQQTVDESVANNQPALWLFSTMQPSGMITFSSSPLKPAGQPALTVFMSKCRG